MELTETESIFCQALAMTSLIGELSNNDFLKSDYYKHLKFTGNNKIIKKILEKSSIGNPATMQMFLYVLLVMPREILKNCSDKYIKQCKIEINRLCTTLAEQGTNSSYDNENDISSIDYYCHIRNAVSHARCSYHIKDKVCYVIFDDINQRNPRKQCKIIMKTRNVGTLMENLQNQIMTYINKRWETK